VRVTSIIINTALHQLKSSIVGEMSALTVRIIEPSVCYTFSMNVKQQFPDEDSLKSYLRSNIGEFLKQVKAEVGPLEAEYLKQSKLRKTGVWFMSLAPFVLIFGSEILRFLPFMGTEQLVVVIVPVAVAGYMFWVGWDKIMGTGAAIAAFHNRLNDVIYPLVFSIFDLSAARIAHTQKSKKDYDTAFKHEGESNWASTMRLAQVAQQLQSIKSHEFDKVMTLLDHSELITEPRNRVKVDDMLITSVYDRPLFFSELNVKHVTGSGKNKRTKKIFHGYFVSFDLKRPLSGKTFVSTEGDKKGFGHQSFFTTKKNAGLEATELEWNDFENLLHVVTNDPTEARYILTPDFMLDLYSWWKEKQENIRISFRDDKMYVLFPDKGVRIGKTISHIDKQELQAYLESISIPLLHTLHLIEDVQQ